ncbi:MAG: class A beta-lactamase-related serine hydrolase [Chloroflexi bacterium]|nr:class A beta-lactamase-related serine hydrolase [Chloroflexota bacterium]
MRSRSPFSALRFLSVALILIAAALAAVQLVAFSRVRANFPSGLRIAGIPVGGLNRQQAAQRLLEVYSLPVELRYGDSIIHLNPSTVEFQLDLDSMLAAADVQRTENLFWQDYWDYLWGRTTSPQEIPLRATYSEPRLRAYLAELAERYDQPASPAVPIPGTVNFKPGEPGSTLDIDGAVTLIERALRSTTNRSVILPLDRTLPGGPAFQNLQVLLQQTIQAHGFDGIVDIYLLDLQTAREMHFAVQNGETLSVQPDIAFTASSIIKVPIMVSAFRRMTENADPETMGWMRNMIVESGNEVADWLMDRVIDPTRGPLVVTEDMRILGLENTFMAGKFTLGSPLLQVIETPANSREDVDTDPDPYSQTTPSDIGMLLADLYQCAQTGGGSLMAAFPGDFTQRECEIMIDYLKNNRLPVLLTAGLPEATDIAHKHGWVSLNGIINTVGDAGIVYTPGGNYVLVIFMHHPQQLIWDPAALLVADLSKAVYNFYNVDRQG